MHTNTDLSICSKVLQLATDWYTYLTINIKRVDAEQAVCVYGMSGYKGVNTLTLHVWFWGTSVVVWNSGLRVWTKFWSRRISVRFQDVSLSMSGLCSLLCISKSWDGQHTVQEPSDTHGVCLCVYDESDIHTYDMHARKHTHTNMVQKRQSSYRCLCV